MFPIPVYVQYRFAFDSIVHTLSNDCFSIRGITSGKSWNVPANAGGHLVCVVEAPHMDTPEHNIANVERKVNDIKKILSNLRYSGIYRKFTMFSDEFGR